MRAPRQRNRRERMCAPGASPDHALLLCGHMPYACPAPTARSHKPNMKAPRVHMLTCTLLLLCCRRRRRAHLSFTEQELTCHSQNRSSAQVCEMLLRCAALEAPTHAVLEQHQTFARPSSDLCQRAAAGSAFYFFTSWHFPFLNLHL